MVKKKAVEEFTPERSKLLLQREDLRACMINIPKSEMLLQIGKTNKLFCFFSSRDGVRINKLKLQQGYCGAGDRKICKNGNHLNWLAMGSR